MMKFLLLIFCLYVVCVETTGSHETKIPKCAKTPDTWKKVEAAIKECQEDVKLNIIKDTFYSNEWDDTIFDDGGHFPFSDGHEDHSAIIYDHHSHVSDHSSHTLDHDTPIYNHHPQINDHHPQIHDHPQIYDHNPQKNQDHVPQIHDLLPQFHDHHPQIHDHHPKTEQTHSPIHDSATTEHFPTLLSHETLSHRPHEHSATTLHRGSHDLLQIEASQLKKPQPFVHSAHSDSTKNIDHGPGKHVPHAISMSDNNPIEQDHFIDFNEFRKKRHANDHGHIHPATATYYDKRIAGCIMQCIYKKNHAVDMLGWPTLDGLVNLYSEGVNDHGYFMATLRAADYCLKGSSAKYHVNRRSTPEKGQTCDVAFDVFDCISDQITEYCSDN